MTSRTRTKSSSTLLAAQAAVAIENARLYESATRWSRQLESLHEIVRSIVDEIELTGSCSSCASGARADRRTRWRSSHCRLGDERASRSQRPTVPSSEPVARSGTALEPRARRSSAACWTAQSARVDSLLDDPDVAQEEARAIGARTGLYVPLDRARRALGVIAVHDKLGGDARFTDGDLRLVEIFAARAAVAVALSERVARDTVRRVIDAQEAERRRLALELHDETGQALTSILLGLKSIRARTQRRRGGAGRGGRARARRPGAAGRARARRRAAPVGARRLRPRPGARAARARPSASEAASRPFGRGALEERLPPEIETTLYRVVQEALSNIVKHSAPEHVSIVVSQREARSRRRSTTTAAASTAPMSATTRSVCWACASASRSSAARSRSSLAPGVRDDHRRSGAADEPDGRAADRGCASCATSPPLHARDRDDVPPARRSVSTGRPRSRSGARVRRRTAVDRIERETRACARSTSARSAPPTPRAGPMTSSPCSAQITGNCVCACDAR